MTEQFQARAATDNSTVGSEVQMSEQLAKTTNKLTSPKKCFVTKGTFILSCSN